MMKMTESQRRVCLAVKKSRIQKKLPKHWHTATVASLLRREFLKITSRGLTVTKWGEAALQYDGQVKYQKWKDTLTGTAQWARARRAP